MATSKYGLVKLSDDNYYNWEVRMKDFLTIKDCIEAVTDAQHPQSAKALAYIRTNVEDQYLPIIRDKPNAMEAWDALARSTACLLALQRDLSRLKMDTNETISSYVGRARTLLNRLNRLQ